VINPVFYAFSSVVVEDFWFRHDGSSSLSFFCFGDGDVSCVVWVDEDVSGFHVTGFAWGSPSDEEAVVVEVLVEFVFILVFAVFVVEEFVYGVRHGEDTEAVFWCCGEFYIPGWQAICSKEHLHCFVFMFEGVGAGVFDFSSVV